MAKRTFADTISNAEDTKAETILSRNENCRMVATPLHTHAHTTTAVHTPWQRIKAMGNEFEFYCSIVAHLCVYANIAFTAHCDKFNDDIEKLLHFKLSSFHSLCAWMWNFRRTKHSSYYRDTARTE